MTHEQFITLETAKLAKQARFDWEVNSYLSYYGNCPDNPHWAVSVNQEYRDWNNYKFKHIPEAYSCPTQSVLQRWLREVKGMYIEITHTITDEFYVTIHSKNFIVTKHVLTENGQTLTFPTYEAALESGEQKWLTLLIENQ